MSATSIEWTDVTWNPVRGCTRVSEGCRNCYAERIAVRMSGPGQWGEGFASVPRRHSQTGAATSGVRGQWTGKVELVEEKLEEPLPWRKRRRVFVNSMSDLFHEKLPDRAIDRVFASIILAPDHTYQILTKRAKRMRAYFAGNPRQRWFDELDRLRREDQGYLGWFVRTNGWPALNPEVGGDPLDCVWLGVSVEDQKTAEARVPFLLKTPAAKRFVSYEPALGPVSFRQWINPTETLRTILEPGPRWLDWIIVGGESGPGARAFEVDWARSTVEQCRASGTRVFVKQLGSRPRDLHATCADNHPESECWPTGTRTKGHEIKLVSPKGGDPLEWPTGLRRREMP